VRARGIIAMTTGNHAQAVAYHAAALGIAATIVMLSSRDKARLRWKCQAEEMLAAFKADGFAPVRIASGNAIE
jgi:cation transport ATPase